jgi:hypothetical protein
LAFFTKYSSNQFIRRGFFFVNMVTITVKGHQIQVPQIKDSFTRRAEQLKNRIITALTKIGLTADDVVIELERIPIKRMPASARWYLNGHRLEYTYGLQPRYIDNLSIIAQVIECEVRDLLADKKHIQEFISHFTEEEDASDQRQEARELLGLASDCTDLDVIDKAYKQMAKDLHPDMPNGDIDKFKAINKAHKLLRKELQ